MIERPAVKIAGLFKKVGVTMSKFSQQCIMEPYNNMIVKCKVLDKKPPFYAEYNLKYKCCELRAFTNKTVKIPPSFTRIGISHFVLQYIDELIILGDTELVAIDVNSYFVYFSYIKKNRITLKNSNTYIKLVKSFLKDYNKTITSCSDTTLVSMLKNMTEKIYEITQYNPLVSLIDSFNYTLICINEDLVYDVHDIHNNAYRLRVCIERILGDKDV